MLNQSLHQKLLQKLSPQQIQLMKLLQVPTVALEQRIKEELQTNPALEEGKEEEDEVPAGEEEDEFDGEDSSGEETTKDDDFNIDDYLQDDDVASYKYNSNNSSPDDERFEIPVAVSVSFQDSLLSQLGLYNFDDRQYAIATQVIGSIDDDGYLRRQLKAIADDLVFSQNITTDENEIQELLKKIQELDPPGIGARSLQECLLLQLQRKEHKTPPVQLAIEIISQFMEEFSKKHYDKIQKQLDITEEDLKGAIQEILKLNPKPGDTFSEGAAKTQQAVVPDFILTNNEGILELTLNSKNAPELRISKSYQEMLETYSKNKDKNGKVDRDAIMFVKQKLDAAKWFIDAIRQRQHTLLRTMQAILEYQYEYFQDGDETKMRPMILKDIADKVGLDISTISRVANSKYAQTPFGTFLLKSFFSEGLQTDSGEEVSSREVKKILSDCIGAESKKKPLTDEKLTKILKDKGYNIARRTVAKYREQLEIPVARLRKEL